METPSGIDEKIYKAIVSIVDHRMRELKVARKDFDGLKSAVTALAEAQGRTEQKVEELAEAQRRTDERLSSLVLKVEELAEAQRKTDAAVEKLAETVEVLGREMRQLARQVGALSDNIGFGIEDVAHVVLPGYLYRHLGIEMGEFERRFITIDGEQVEINLYAEGRLKGAKVTILGEVKSRIHGREVEHFEETLSRVLPTIQGRVVKVMSGYLFRPEASELARKYDILPVVSYQR